MHTAPDRTGLKNQNPTNNTFLYTFAEPFAVAPEQAVLFDMIYYYKYYDQIPLDFTDQNGEPIHPDEYSHAKVYECNHIPGKQYIYFE